jgi:hypothetical protein
MTHRLLVFGDSWAYGSELADDCREQQCFGGQLGKLLTVDSVHNCAETGSSISHLHLQFQNALTRMNYDPADQYTAVFFLTGQQRFLAFDPNNEFYNLIPAGASIRPVQHQHRMLIETVNDFYYKNIQSDQADVIALNANLLALQAICRYHNIQDYYISGWQDLHVWPEVDQTRIYPYHCQALLDSDVKYFEPNVSHPNALGHKLIADRLFDFMKLKQLDNTI